MRVVIAPDSFKGSITAIAAAAALAAGWRDARPADVVTTLPLADGGDHHPHRAPYSPAGWYRGRPSFSLMACWISSLPGRASTVATYSFRRNSSSTGFVFSW